MTQTLHATAILTIPSPNYICTLDMNKWCGLNNQTTSNCDWNFSGDVLYHFAKNTKVGQNFG